LPPLSGYNCSCSAGYFDDEGTCADINGCSESTCGSFGTCVDVAAPGTGFTCTCSDGYVSTNLVCVNQDGCATYPSSGGSCLTTDSTARCADVASPGTGYSCTCAAGYYVNTATPNAPTCSYRDCGAPSTQTGYTIASGTTYYGSTRTITCASGYSGTATSRTCQSSGSWTSSTGCTLDCSSPSQSGYTIASGSNGQGATRTTTCAIGYGKLLVLASSAFLGSTASFHPDAFGGSPPPYGITNNLNDVGWIYNVNDYFRVDLGSAMALYAIRLYSVYTSGQRGATMTVFSSDNDSTWTSVGTWNYVGGGINDDGTTRSDYGGWYPTASTLFTSAGSHRYWKMTMTAVLYSHMPNTAQVEFYAANVAGSSITCSTSSPGRAPLAAYLSCLLA